MTDTEPSVTASDLRDELKPLWVREKARLEAHYHSQVVARTRLETDRANRNALARDQAQTACSELEQKLELACEINRFVVERAGLIEALLCTCGNKAHADGCPADVADIPWTAIEGVDAGARGKVWLAMCTGDNMGPSRSNALLVDYEAKLRGQRDALRDELRTVRDWVRKSLGVCPLCLQEDGCSPLCKFTSLMGGALTES